VYERASKSRASRPVAALKQVPGIVVEVVDGSGDELTVLVGRRVVAKKEGDSLPATDEFVTAVREAAGVRTRLADRARRDICWPGTASTRVVPHEPPGRVV
jgi:hypothetical protein